MTVPLISVITAAYGPTADYLQETAESVAAQDLPDGWSLEWVVQEDGDSPRLGGFFEGLPFASYGANGRQYGTALTRNLALSRASGVLMQALDQDDVLLPGALTTLIPRFSEHRIHWAIGQADDLLPDGSRRAYPSPIPFGVYAAGDINAWAADRGGNWPIHCAALMMRTASVRALGGWTGIPYDDELATFAALSAVTDGYYDETLTWLYRHHPRQVHRTEAAQELSAAGRRIALQRARAAASSGLCFAPDAAIGFADHHENVHVGPVDKDTSLPAGAVSRH
jgi:glycosyltransferase involved in cell wall biosynthesis